MGLNQSKWRSTIRS